MGAGVVGVAQAWYLARAGFEVSVLEANEGPGLETSFANGGQISACHTQPWASPAVARQVLDWFGRDDAPLVMHLMRVDPALWHWGLLFLTNCTRRKFLENMERAIRPALYSRRLLGELRRETGLEYRESTAGILKIYRSERAFEDGLRALDAARPWGLEQTVLTPEACTALEPALARVEGALAGAIHAPGDESGDAYRFTAGLARLARDRGVRFHFGTRIQRLEKTRGRIARVHTDQGAFEADIYVLALGVGSPRVARTVGLRLPVYPVKGYSVTLPVGGDSVHAPRVSITDEERRMVYSRLGSDLRAAGTAEFSGVNKTMVPARVELIRRELGALFPGAGDPASATPWVGLRPTTPDNAPILGFAPGVENLLLNTGHGTLGWTQACGCARVTADLAGSKTPEISLEGLGASRFAF